MLVFTPFWSWHLRHLVCVQIMVGRWTWQCSRSGEICPQGFGNCRNWCSFDAAMALSAWKCVSLSLWLPKQAKFWTKISPESCCHSCHGQITSQYHSNPRKKHQRVEKAELKMWPLLIAAIPNKGDRKAGQSHEHHIINHCDNHSKPGLKILT